MADYFSNQSAVYAKNRPFYPNELFLFLKDICAEHQLAWDVATGNGQCAVSLADYFKNVFATDLSAQQLGNSFQRPNITYKLEHAEQSSLPDCSVDLITVATAIHWFDIPAFYKEVQRVLKPNGILAVWGYAASAIDVEIDKIINEFAFETLESYWPAQTRLNWEDKYEHLPFPYPLLNMPIYKAAAQQNYAEFISYMNSWSAIQVYLKQHHQNPIDQIQEKLLNAWGNADEVKTVLWQLNLKCGRNAV